MSSLDEPFAALTLQHSGKREPCTYRLPDTGQAVPVQVGGPLLQLWNPSFCW
jgi:hypothetical protein